MFVSIQIFQDRPATLCVKIDYIWSVRNLDRVASRLQDTSAFLILSPISNAIAEFFLTLVAR